MPTGNGAVTNGFGTICFRLIFFRVTIMDKILGKNLLDIM